MADFSAEPHPFSAAVPMPVTPAITDDAHRRRTRDVLAAKLSPLVQRAFEIPRLEAVGRLNRAGHVKVVLVRAPAGFGKTTVMLQLREAMEKDGCQTAWLTLDRSDNDAPRLLSGLAAAVGQFSLDRDPESVGGVMELLATETGAFALFLDDFETLREGSGVSLVREVIDNLPPNGRLVIGSRSLPDLGLGRLRGRGQLLELDADVLRFSTAEASEFFRLRGADLSLEALDRTYSKTEGWAAALWLLSIALQRHGSGNELVTKLAVSERDVADYLTEEVLNLQTPTIRSFLIRSSVLRHLSAPVCQAILPHIDCAAVLEELERSNVFLTPVAAATGLYRYHSLFADFLRGRLASEEPEQIARLHLAASGWYEAEGRPVPAIDHAIEGGDYPHALNILQEQVETLLEQGRMRLLDRWFTSIPGELQQGRPLLKAIAVWARCFTQGPWRGMELLQASGCVENRDGAVQAHVRALLPVLLAMMDRYDEAYEAGVDGVRRLPSGNAFADSVLLNAMAHIVSVTGERDEAHRFIENARRSQGVSAFNRMYTETVEGVLDLREGRLRQATARFRMALTSTSHTSRYAYNYAHGNAWAGVFYAGVLYESNDLPGAERLLNVYLPLARDVGLPDHLISSHRIRARISFQTGDVDMALQTLTELEYIGHQRKLPRVVANAKLERSRLLMLQGNGPAAREEITRANDRAVWDAVTRKQWPAQDVEDLVIGRLRIELRFGDSQAEIGGIESALRQAMISERRHRALKFRLLLALGLHRNGEVGRAINEMQVALQEASREGFVRIVLDEGPELMPVVRRVLTATDESGLTTDPIFSEYLLRLIGLYGPVAAAEEDSSSVTEGALAEPLTRKEIRILQLLGEGYSNTAMSEKLYVSDSTVRTHLRNINGKLKSRSRTQAVAVARRLGIIR